MPGIFQPPSQEPLLSCLTRRLWQAQGLPTDGPLFKSVSGELSNLRWDLPLAELPNYWGKGNRKAASADWQLLANFTRGLAGGGPVPRCDALPSQSGLRICGRSSATCARGAAAFNASGARQLVRGGPRP